MYPKNEGASFKTIILLLILGAVEGVAKLSLSASKEKK